MNLIYLSLKLERKSGRVFLFGFPPRPQEMEEFESQVTVRIEELRWVGMTEGIVKYLTLWFRSLLVLLNSSIIKKCCSSK